MALINNAMHPGRNVWAVLFMRDPPTVKIELFETEDEAFKYAEKFVGNGECDWAHVYDVTYINTVQAEPRVLKRRF